MDPVFTPLECLLPTGIVSTAYISFKSVFVEMHPECTTLKGCFSDGCCYVIFEETQPCSPTTNAESGRISVSF